MIMLTRLNGQKFILNAELIKYIEETPDTIITLNNDEKIIVKEKAEKIIEDVIKYIRLTRGITREIEEAMLVEG